MGTCVRISAMNSSRVAIRAFRQCSRPCWRQFSGSGVYTVALPCTLWFLDRGKTKGKHKDEVLFIDARNIYRQVTRAIHDFRPEQIESLANIVRLYRGVKVETILGSKKLLAEQFPDARYRDVPGLCKVAKRADIESQGWSLNPGRYVGVKPGETVSNEDFKAQVETLNEELEALNLQARVLEQTIASNVADILEA
jgi:type I restriction enzyme M protein